MRCATAITFSRVATVFAVAALWLIVAKLYVADDVARSAIGFSGGPLPKSANDAVLAALEDVIDDDTIAVAVSDARAGASNGNALERLVSSGKDGSSSQSGDANASHAGNRTSVKLTGRRILKSDVCKHVQEIDFKNAVLRENIRYLFMEGMRPGYGFTNQLLVYSALALYAVQDKRRIVFPAARVPFHELISINGSRFTPEVPVSKSLCEDAAAEVYLTGVRIKSGIYDGLRKALARGHIIADPTTAMSKYHGFMHTTRVTRIVRLWDMYGRWPYGARTQPDWMTFEWFLCSIRFGQRVEERAERLYEAIADAAMKFHRDFSTTREKPTGDMEAAQRQWDVEYGGNATHARYVAVHLRMEPQDMHSMGRSWSNATHVARFFEETVFPIAHQQKTRTLLLCSGKLDPEVDDYIAAITHVHGFQVLRKTDFFNDTFGRVEHGVVASEYVGRKLIPTSTHGASVDLLLLERAAAVVVTAFSSFSAAIYGRRCCEKFTDIGAASFNASNTPFSPFGGGPQSGNVFLYEVYQDGSITEAVEFPCGFQLGDYIVGRSIPRPPTELNVFNPNFNRSSPLFHRFPERNDGPTIFPPNVERYRRVLPKGINPLHHGGGPVVQVGKRFGAGGKYMRIKKRV